MVSDPDTGDSEQPRISGSSLGDKEKFDVVWFSGICSSDIVITSRLFYIFQIFQPFHNHTSFNVTHLKNRGRLA